MSTTAGERFERLTVLQVHAKITDGWRPMWVDVRKPHEWAQGTIERAEHFIPHDTVIANGLPGVPLDTPVLLQCRSGVRSAHAAAALVARGFTDVTNLEGGILAWTEAYR